MSNRSISQRGGSFLINWVMLTAVGWAIGSTLRRIGFSLASATVGFAAGRVVEGAVIGAAIGIAQAIALPSSFSRKTWWVLGSTLAWAVAWSAGWSFGWMLERPQRRAPSSSRRQPAL